MHYVFPTIYSPSISNHIYLCIYVFPTIFSPSISNHIYLCIYVFPTIYSPSISIHIYLCIMCSLPPDLLLWRIPIRKSLNSFHYCPAYFFSHLTSKFIYKTAQFSPMQLLHLQCQILATIKASKAFVFWHLLIIKSKNRFLVAFISHFY